MRLVSSHDDVIIIMVRGMRIAMILMLNFCDISTEKVLLHADGGGPGAGVPPYHLPKFNSCFSSDIATKSCPESPDNESEFIKSSLVSWS